MIDFFGARAAKAWLAGAVAAVLLAAASAVLTWTAPTIEGRIEPGTIDKERGEAYVAVVDPVRSPFFVLRGAAVGQRAKGRLALLEGGRPLGPADVNHDDIRANGRGAYSYWDRTVYFSTSDNTDPRTNGRSYGFRARAAPHDAVLNTGKGAALVALVMTLGWLRASRQPGRQEGRAEQLGKALGDGLESVVARFAAAKPSSLAGHIVWPLLFGFAGVFALIFMWRSGQSGHLGAAALLPVSDAMGYYRCALMGAEGSATALGATSPGTITSFGIPGEWCSRRSIWPLTMITILSATGWHAGVALLVQAFMIGAALGVITLAAWRTYGLMSAVLIAWIGGAFALEWALGTFMTENWGLVAGFTGAALLMEHAKRPRPVILALGLAMTSIALAARAGALFVLPLLFVWGYSTLLPPGRRWSAVALGVTAAALFVGPALQWAGSIHYLGDVSNTGGNFSTSLYGLSTGSRDWSEAYRDFKPQFAQSPEAEVFKVVQQRAIDNILTHPAVFIGSLKAAGGAFIASIFAVGAGLQRFYYIFAILLVIGTLYSLYQTLRTREAVFALPLVFLAAECMAAPLIVDSGGQRVFAATFWVRPLLVGVGATFAITLLVRFIRGRAIDSTTHTGTSNFPWPMASLAGLVVVASAVPLVAPSGSLRPRPVVDTFQCDPGEIPVIARLGRESMALSVGFESALPLAGPLRVTPGQLERHHHWYNSWWSRGTGYLTTGATIVLAFDARPESRGQLVSLFSERALPPSASGLYRVCAGDELERSLGDFPLRSVSRFEPAE